VNDIAQDPLVSKLTWSDDVDAIIGGDLTAGLAYVTPAGGTVLSAVAPIGIRDRDAGTVGFTTSLGFGRKLDRITRDPKVALAYHTRQHGFATPPGVVVVQGTATVVPTTEELRDELTARAERFLGPLKRGWFWDRWLKAYYDDRVLVTVRVERILSWPDEVGTGAPAIIGPPLPDTPPQSPPKRAPPLASTWPRRLASSRRRTGSWRGAAATATPWWSRCEPSPRPPTTCGCAPAVRSCRRADAGSACWPTSTGPSSSACAPPTPWGGWRSPNRAKAASTPTR
jgi:hypothetical protein